MTIEFSLNNLYGIDKGRRDQVVKSISLPVSLALAAPWNKSLFSLLQICQYLFFLDTHRQMYPGNRITSLLQTFSKVAKHENVYNWLIWNRYRRETWILRQERDFTWNKWSRKWPWVFRVLEIWRNFRNGIEFSTYWELKLTIHKSQRAKWLQLTFGWHFLIGS